MSALPPKADMCGATSDVRFVPIADISDVELLKQKDRHASRGEEPMAKMMKTAERALHKRTNKMLASATKRYKKFMRQAAKAASDYKREEYLAAALSALVVTGVVASKLMANLEGKKAAAPGPARKKRKTKAK